MLVLSRERGAVNILFLVMVLVLALIFGTLWFLQLQENEELSTRLQSERNRSNFEAQRSAWARDYHNSFAGKIGGGFPTSFPVQEGTVPDALAQETVKPFTTGVETKISEVLARVDEGALQPQNLMEAIEIPVTRYLAKKAEVTSLQTTIVQKDAEIAAKSAEIESLKKAHADQLSAATATHGASQSALKAINDALEQTNTEVQTKISTLVDESKVERESLNTSRNDALAQKNELEGQVRSIKSELRIERAKETPDGKVLSADSETGICLISISSKEQLRRGTRFKVYETGKGGEKIHKGWVTVTDTRPDMSVARIDETVPGKGGIDADDWLYNPIFNPAGEVHFLFLGQTPGRYTREVAERILESFGAKIDKKVTTRTDFIVVGEKETEDADELTESPEYKNAQTWGIEMIRPKDLEPFLQR